ncbi:MAG: outer membrane beta-barrel protein [Alistipes sp.]|nr:outer membrane beta-barrel protein [Alistipes sp.]
MRKLYITLTALLCALCAGNQQITAQVLPNAYFNIDWQLGIPLSNDFADKTSGWGMNFEGGYFLTDAITIGGFLNYQTSFRKFPRETLQLSDGSALTTSQKHALFHLPFGVAARYNWLTDSIFQPYAGLKLGASYAQISSYYYIYKQYEDTWGFHLQPEIGVSIFPRPDMRFGFHAAFYYSYSTNQGDLLTYSLNGINNFGFRFGISF